MKKILTSGGALLMGSAAVSKLLGLLRDRLLVSHLSASELDQVFAAFRIPDFFFFLLVGGTVATLLIPRLKKLSTADHKKFFSSFLWLIISVFGVFCALGVFFPAELIRVFATGFDITARTGMIDLVRLLFGSVWLLAASAVFGAAQQEKQKFLSVALAPVLYTAAICIGIYFFVSDFGLAAVGCAAIVGSFLHFSTNSVAYFICGGRLGFHWREPVSSWQKITSDFLSRIATNAAFQINLSIDVWIASHLAAGGVAACQLGTNLGMALLSMVGIPLAAASFPKLTSAHNDKPLQQKILRNTLAWVMLATIPAAIIGAVFARFWLVFLFNADGELLRLGSLIFQIVVLSLPAACAIPVLSRLFLANDDTRTPLRITIISISIATAVAISLSLFILPPDIAVLGLGIATFIANVSSALLLWRETQKYYRA